MCDSNVMEDKFQIWPETILEIERHQFYGEESDDPFLHYLWFLKFCNTIHFFKGDELPKVDINTLRFELFPYSLAFKAKEWLESYPAGSINTWYDLDCKFTAKFAEPYINLEIASCTQKEGESLLEVLFKHNKIFEKYPGYFEERLKVETLYNNIRYSSKLLLDDVIGCSLLSLNNKSPKVALHVIESIALYDSLGLNAQQINEDFNFTQSYQYFSQEVVKEAIDATLDVCNESVNGQECKEASLVIHDRREIPFIPSSLGGDFLAPVLNFHKVDFVLKEYGEKINIYNFLFNSPLPMFATFKMQVYIFEDERSGGKIRLNPQLSKAKGKPKVKIKEFELMTTTEGTKPPLALCYKPP